MIKKILIYSIAVFGIGFSYGQSIEPDARLQIKYTQSELQELKQENQEELKFLNFCIDNAFTLMSLPEGKSGASEIRGNVSIDDLNNINFFSLGYDLEEVNWQYYKIEGTNQMLVIFSREEIIKKMKK